jgi:hypothetical protein
MKFSLLAAAALLASTQAFAVPAFIDFDDAQSTLPISPTQGVTFGEALLGLNNTDGFGPYFSNGSDGAMFVTSGSVAQQSVNVAAGFTGLSFSYSSTEAFDVLVFDDLDGAGNLLATLSLVANATAGGCTDTPYCNFDVVGTSFAGVARSISFANAFDVQNNVGLALIDNLAIPEPTTGLLAALALGGLLATRLRT